MADSLAEMTNDVDDLFSVVLVDLIPELAKELLDSGNIELEPQVQLTRSHESIQVCNLI
jgi:hypothetical protein